MSDKRTEKRLEERQKKKDHKKEIKKLYAQYDKIADEAGLDKLEKALFIKGCIEKGVKPEDFLNEEEDQADQIEHRS